MKTPSKNATAPTTAPTTPVRAALRVRWTELGGDSIRSLSAETPESATRAGARPPVLLRRKICESLILAEGDEIVVGREHLLDPVVELDRAPEVVERLVGAPGACGEATGVEVRDRAVGALLDHHELFRKRLGVVAGVVRGERLSGFCGRRLVRLPGGSADDEDRRARLGRGRLALGG